MARRNVGLRAGRLVATADHEAAGFERLRDRVARRQVEIRKLMPYALDLLTLSVGAGLDFTAALERIVPSRVDFLRFLDERWPQFIRRVLETGTNWAGVGLLAAFLADRSDISEELVRADSHIRQFRAILADEEPAGRKLNFLVQEFNREFNTIGSKTGSADVSHRVVWLKSELEKIREQIQNVE